MLMQPDQVRELILAALKDRSPKGYKELQRAGALSAFLDRTTQMVVESVNLAQDRASVGSAPANPVTAVQASNNAANVAQEVALAQVMEEIEAMPGGR